MARTPITERGFSRNQTIPSSTPKYQGPNFGVAGWTVVSTSQAARDGARAYSLGEDPRAAAEGALPGVMEIGGDGGSLSAEGYTYTVTVSVPSVVKIDLGSVTRSATMPVIE